MRLILGVIIGIALSVGGAYLHDQPLPAASKQRLVNWDVAGELSGWAVDRARQEWDHLTTK